jgi:hypothetical protein
MGQSKEAEMADETATIEVETPEVEQDDSKAELERTRLALKAANKESADRRKRLEQLEAAEAERTSAAMTETDRLKAELEAEKAKSAQADERAKQTLIRAAFVSEAAKAGAAYPEDVERLADLAGVDVDESGKVTGVPEAVEALVKSGRIPMSGKTPAPNLDGGAGGGDRSKGQVRLTADELEMARKLNITPERYQANKAAMQVAES